MQITCLESIFIESNLWTVGKHRKWWYIRTYCIVSLTHTKDSVQSIQLAQITQKATDPQTVIAKN